jgi:hypothetical protein
MNGENWDKTGSGSEIASAAGHACFPDIVGPMTRGVTETPSPVDAEW